MKTVGLLSSVWTYKCPRCRQANLYITPINLANPLNMHKRCEVCDLNFEPEPGYYFGAMFMSYGISAFFFLAIAALLYFGFDLGPNPILAWVIFIGLVCFLKILRLSRSVWIHVMVRYDSRKVEG